jgi:kynurenine formamidase
MPRKIVDLSIWLENDVLSDPPSFAPKIEYFTHADSFHQMAPFFPGLTQQDLPDAAVWAVETVQLSTHNGTHLDAPYHFHPTAPTVLSSASISASQSISRRPPLGCDGSERLIACLRGRFDRRLS